MIPKRIRQWLAAKKLDRITRERAASFEVEQYRRRRAAALKGLAIKRIRRES